MHEEEEKENFIRRLMKQILGDLSHVNELIQQKRPEDSMTNDEYREFIELWGKTNRELNNIGLYGVMLTQQYKKIASEISASSKPYDKSTQTDCDCGTTPERSDSEVREPNVSGDKPNNSYQTEEIQISIRITRS